MKTLVRIKIGCENVLTLPSTELSRMSLRQLASIFPAPDLMKMSLPAFMSRDLVGDSNLIRSKQMKLKAIVMQTPFKPNSIAYHIICKCIREC